jgi:hypothetical protein
MEHDAIEPSSNESGEPLAGHESQASGNLLHGRSQGRQTRAVHSKSNRNAAPTCE